MTFTNEKNTMTLNYLTDFVGVSRQLVDSIGLKKNGLVFVGYGIVAPEYNWNDYKDVNVKGKTVVVLVNDPGLVSNDKKNFKGKAWMQQKETEWLANNYHKTTDQYETWWDLKGVEQDAKLLFEVRYELSNSSVFSKMEQIVRVLQCEKKLAIFTTKC